MPTAEESQEIDWEAPKSPSHSAAAAHADKDPSAAGRQATALPVPLRRLQLVVNLCNAIEGVDLQLLPSSFKALEGSFGLSPSALGRLSLVQALCQASAGPLWGHMADNVSRNLLLSFGCCFWGVLSMLFASSQYYYQMLVLRALNGVALASVGPVCQSIIADMFPSSERGGAFGLIQLALCSGMILGALFATSLSRRQLTDTLQGWRVAFALAGMTSCVIGMFMCTRTAEAPRPRQKRSHSDRSSVGDHGELVPADLGSVKIRHIMRKRTFLLLLGQGLFGYIPLNAFAFCTMWYQYVGFSDAAAALLTALLLFGGAIGGLIGGVLGDKASVMSRYHGRPCVGQFSSLAGIPLVWLLLQRTPRDTDHFFVSAVLMFLSGTVATWGSVAVNRPVLAEIVPAQKRATLFAIMVALEGSAAAFLGAPVVALLAEWVYGYELPSSRDLPRSDPSAVDVDVDPAVRSRNVTALANSLTLAITIPWALCFVCYSLLHLTYRRDATQGLPTRQHGGYVRVGVEEEARKVSVDESGHSAAAGQRSDDEQPLRGAVDEGRAERDTEAATSEIRDGDTDEYIRSRSPVIPNSPPPDAAPRPSTSPRLPPVDRGGGGVFSQLFRLLAGQPSDAGHQDKERQMDSQDKRGPWRAELSLSSGPLDSSSNDRPDRPGSRGQLPHTKPF
ncbi:unnamed protein product [Vitrella brassicaformis CCMP3155]|uniref:Major facilitator superfamily (MFS) profile domain-containing protein n=1 Tax=Vitrella brassicaformis (strain CCMP3155) TaxID=1169540 RepID=A0A0G4EZC5_VITBC|nr:unnamed protein product [Vitrella brassicaformis CCMP3155]|eukprot:CEM04668.1 unnamed protein product [Vitrella brassicaformis CCMP3155]